MTKDGLLKSIAEMGYNVGFGAKKHFATFDIVSKVPGWITFASLAVGILGLAIEQLAAKIPSAFLTIVGVIGLYVTAYDAKKEEFEQVGIRLTLLFNELRDLYRSVQGGKDLDISAEILKDIEKRYYEVSISKQIFLSDWYAHYKFFWQMQIDWIDEQMQFSTVRDKIPLSLYVTFGLVIAIASIAIIGPTRLSSLFNVPEWTRLMQP